MIISQQRPDYNQFFIEIKNRIRTAQYEAMKSVNKEMIQLYWDIGKQITEKQNASGWGKAIVETLSKDLQNEFPGIKGFGTCNIWYMQQFYSEYQDNENLVIMSKCKDIQEKQFYILATKKFGWTKDVLIHKIDCSTI